MKINQIKKLIMETKHCVILTGMQGQQWIGGRNWMVRVDDRLRITGDSLRGLFDLDTNQAEKLVVEELPMESYPLWPVLKRDINPMKVCPLGIDDYGGVELLIFGNAVYMLQQKYVKAVISQDDYREYMLAWDEGNRPLIVIDDGMLFAGIARPMPVEVCKNMLDNMRALCALEPSGMRTAQDNGPLKLEAEGGIQMDMEDFGDVQADAQ